MTSRADPEFVVSKSHLTFSNVAFGRRQDNMIIQSISLLDTLDKDMNTFAMRVKEWCVQSKLCFSHHPRVQFHILSLPAFAFCNVMRIPDGLPPPFTPPYQVRLALPGASKDRRRQLQVRSLRPLF